MLVILYVYGCLQFGEDLEFYFCIIIGIGVNLNVVVVVVIGIELGWIKCIVDGIWEIGKLVVEFFIEQKGDFEMIWVVFWVVKEFVYMVLEYQCEECLILDFWVFIKCGESDMIIGFGFCLIVGNMYDKLLLEGIIGFFGEILEIIGVEYICQKWVINEEVGECWYKMWKVYLDDVIFVYQMDDFFDSQLIKGNIEGGLIIIEEKVLGNLEKIGCMLQYIDIFDFVEVLKLGNGFYFMDFLFVVVECVMLMVVGGVVIYMFLIGQGNVVGNLIVLVIKIMVNLCMVWMMSEYVDVDVFGILCCEMIIDEVGDELIDIICCIVNGCNIVVEVLGYWEFLMIKLYCSV